MFDVAIAVTVLEFVRHPAAVLAEMVRVVRPGGRVVVAALNPRSLWGMRTAPVHQTSLEQRAIPGQEDSR